VSKVELLATADSEANKKNEPVYYSWINVACHSYFMKFFDIDAGALPTVVFYNPVSNKGAAMVG